MSPTVQILLRALESPGEHFGTFFSPFSHAPAVYRLAKFRLLHPPFRILYSYLAGVKDLKLRHQRPEVFFMFAEL